MPAVAVVGAQWGDEGKGKIIDLLAEKADFVIRFSGGDNAGHTVVNPHGEFTLHIVPAGIFNQNTTCIIGNGVAVNPAVLLREINDLQSRGIKTDKLFIDDRAHVIMPYHVLMDGIEEERRSSNAIGTTRKGIGPVFSDKVARLGIRMGDLLDKEIFRSRLSSILELKNMILTKIYDRPPLILNDIYEQYCSYSEQLAPYIRETGTIIDYALAKGQKILLEGAQGSMLDPDFGTYPFVTSSSPMAASSSSGSGISVNKIGQVIGITKAYTTRVGGGPIPTELLDETGKLIRERAHEYGATTGRPRRCGWFDAVVGRYTSKINGFTGLVLTRLDILDIFPAIKICTGYTLDGKQINYVPSRVSDLAKCEPIYEDMQGWQTDISTIRDYKKLPAQAKKFVTRIEELLFCPVHIVSVGAQREQTIFRKQIL